MIAEICHPTVPSNPTRQKRRAVYGRTLGIFGVQEPL